MSTTNRDGIFIIFFIKLLNFWKYLWWIFSKNESLKSIKTKINFHQLGKRLQECFSTLQKLSVLWCIHAMLLYACIHVFLILIDGQNLVVWNSRTKDHIFWCWQQRLCRYSKWFYDFSFAIFKFCLICAYHIQPFNKKKYLHIISYKYSQFFNYISYRLIMFFHISEFYLSCKILHCKIL